MKVEIDVVKELARIRDIPENGKGSCHTDHIRMSDALNRLIGYIESEEKKK